MEVNKSSKDIFIVFNKEYPIPICYEVLRSMKIKGKQSWKARDFNVNYRFFFCTINWITREEEKSVFFFFFRLCRFLKPIILIFAMVPVVVGGLFAVNVVLICHILKKK